MARLPVSTQTLYAELLERLLAARATGTGASPGTIVSKTIRGRVYWYAQRKDVGRTSQVYLGPDGPETRALLEQRRNAWKGADSERRERERLSAMLVAGGAAHAAPVELRLLRWLADAHVFERGAVLVGTHAFAVLANVLGVKWSGAVARTADVDIALGLRVEVAASDSENAPLADRLKERSNDVRFDPIPPFDRRHPSTSFHVYGTELRLDLLTPLIGKATSKPVMVGALGAPAQPLRFLDYLIDDAIPAAIVGRDGVLVQVPAPARFALHKLLIASKRPASEHTKARKDLSQAEALLDVLAADRPGDLALAWDALAGRGRGWSAPVKAALAKCNAEVAARAKAAGVGG